MLRLSRLIPVSRGDPVFEFPYCSLRKMEQVQTFYPNCNFELQCTVVERRNQPRLIGYSWMIELVSFASSIKKMKLALTLKYIEDYADIIRFESLECLDIEVFPDYRVFPGLENLNVQFWNRFPNLKYLKITSFEKGLIFSYWKRKGLRLKYRI